MSELLQAWGPAVLVFAAVALAAVATALGIEWALALRQRRAVEQRSVIEAVLEDLGAVVAERLEGAEVGHVAGGEEQRRRPAGQCGEALLQGLVDLEVAADQVRGAGAGAEAACAGGLGLGQPWIPAQPQIVVAGEVEDPARRPPGAALAP